MKRLWTLAKNGVTFLWVLLVVCIAIVVTMDNPEPVTLHLFIWPIELSLGIMFFAILILGIVCGLVPCVLSLIWCRQRNKRLLAKLNKSQKELENIRMISSTSNSPIK